MDKDENPNAGRNGHAADAPDAQGPEPEDEEDEYGPIFLSSDDVIREVVLDDDSGAPLEEDDDEDGDYDVGASGAADDDEDDEDEDMEVSVPDESLQVFREHGGQEPVYTVACSPSDASVVATGGGDDRAYLWRIGTNDAVELEGHSDSVGALAFSKDGSFLASGGLEGVVLVWNTSTGKLIQRLEGPGEGIEWLQWHPRGNVLLAGTEDFMMWMWSLPDGKCMQVFSGHNGAVTCGSFTPDGKHIVSGSEDRTARLWEPRSNTATATFQGDLYHQDGVTCLDVSADSAVALTGSSDNTACIINLNSGKVVGRMAKHTDSIEAVGFSSTLPVFATGSLDGDVVFWDLATRQERSIAKHEAGVVKLVWHPTQPLCFTAAQDGCVRVWDARTAECARISRGHTDRILDMALVKDFSMAVTASDDGTARVFQLL